jgi:hypothetical protein
MTNPTSHKAGQAYTPLQAGIADGFVYVVSDGKGGRATTSSP